MNCFEVGKKNQIFAISLIGILVFCGSGFSQGPWANPGGASSSWGIAKRPGNAGRAPYQPTGPNGQQTSGNFPSPAVSPGAKARTGPNGLQTSGNFGTECFPTRGPNGKPTSGNSSTRKKPDSGGGSTSPNTFEPVKKKVPVSMPKVTLPKVPKVKLPKW